MVLYRGTVTLWEREKKAKVSAMPVRMMGEWCARVKSWSPADQHDAATTASFPPKRVLSAAVLGVQILLLFKGSSTYSRCCGIEVAFGSLLSAK